MLLPRPQKLISSSLLRSAPYNSFEPVPASQKLCRLCTCIGSPEMLWKDQRRSHILILISIFPQLTIFERPMRQGGLLFQENALVDFRLLSWVMTLVKLSPPNTSGPQYTWRQCASITSCIVHWVISGLERFSGMKVEVQWRSSTWLTSCETSLPQLKS